MTEIRENDSYVRKVWEDAARYTRDLLRDNHRLRAAVASLEADNRRLRADLDHQYETHRLETSELRLQLHDLEAESRRHLDDYLDVEQQNTNLANLYVASHRLHSSLVRTEVLAGIEEIIVNLIGSEELAIIEVDQVTGHPRIALAFGLSVQKYEDLPSSVHARVEACFESRQVWVRQGAERRHPVTACIPLLIDGRVTGAIVILGLLQQKSDVDPVDVELFSLLATQAATALYAATLH
ncbi:MAG TPA: GAF domain-containing protein, partial [Thermoanaerobaculia bacterium]|nr:GAF domain-containing protein [Thermoanaerobaculia bacterium]